MSKFRREDLIKEAIEDVKECGFIIKYIPDKYVTEELCETAMRNTNGLAYEFLPKKFQHLYSKNMFVHHEYEQEEEEIQISL